MYYEVTDNQEKLVGHENDTIWTGKASASSENIYSFGLGNFVNATMPLISNPTFVAENNVKLAMQYYTMSRNIGFIETQFMAFWFGLEAMANAFYEKEPTDLAITKADWNGLKAVCKKYLQEIGKPQVFDDLLRDISFLRRGTMKDKIDWMLQHLNYQMQMYTPEISAIYDEIRVPFVHGRNVDWSSNFDKVFHLRRIMEKIILKTLNFYDRDEVNYAIKDADLSKV